MLPEGDVSARTRTVLYGGSFNPVHYGHLALAAHVLEKGYADEVWFVLSPQNPLKQQADASSAEGRLEALRNALKDQKRCIASNLELNLPTPSYTVDTVKYAVEHFPDRQFILLIGGDNLDVFTRWKSYEWLLENIDILVYPRPGASNKVPSGWKRVKMLEAPQMAVSSTAIRTGSQ